MKKHGILNGPLSGALATLGHGDLVVVADCGLPLPLNGPVVDLAVVPGVPTFTAVLDALLDELVLESALAADECRGGPVERWIRDRLPEADYIPHEQLKGLATVAKVLVRTGEATPYANIVLRSGVPF
ncbi:D-ribose pyranase [Sinomonas cyclohexanicum]|uniref:D-ribose pyranase n=1 Tax=Sinomonas cyclohexanicum TaxID=322009 RepID=A0ABM7Q0R9_SINCY|nr:D-ribose pyranase [Corynebacterium cyclohexanicum]BCT78075.1 D-ribose pyranase [Corynebacterium cyclohexanicum]